MGERYLVTGSQLGLLVNVDNQEQRKKIIDSIIDSQCVGNSNRSIRLDVKSIENKKWQ